MKAFFKVYLILIAVTLMAIGVVAIWVALATFLGLKGIALGWFALAAVFSYWWSRHL